MKEIVAIRHRNCELVINWARTNSSGNPALVCADHRDKKGRHTYIDWVSTNKIMPLINMGVREIQDEREE